MKHSAGSRGAPATQGADTIILDTLQQLCIEGSVHRLLPIFQICPPIPESSPEDYTVSTVYILATHLHQTKCPQNSTVCGVTYRRAVHLGDRMVKIFFMWRRKFLEHKTQGFQTYQSFLPMSFIHFSYPKLVHKKQVKHKAKYRTKMTTENTRNDNNNCNHSIILKFDQRSFINRDPLPFNCLPHTQPIHQIFTREQAFPGSPWLSECVTFSTETL